MDAITILLGVIVVQAVALGAVMAAFRRQRTHLESERFRARCAEEWLIEKAREEEARDRTKSVGRRELDQMRSILDRPR